MLIKLIGAVVSKKNSRQGFVRNGRSMNIPSKAFRKWHPDAMLQLVAQRVPKDKIKFVKQIEIIHYSPFRKDGSESTKMFDVTNKSESVMDLLVDYGFIEDDNWKVTPRVISDHGGFRSESGCDIKIDI